MKEITTIGADLAKNVLKVHAIDAAGVAVIRRKLRRSQMPTQATNQIDPKML